MWHVSSRSGVATLRTAIHLLLTYLLRPVGNNHLGHLPTRLGLEFTAVGLLFRVTVQVIRVMVRIIRATGLGRRGRVVSASDGGVRGPGFESRRGR